MSTKLLVLFLIASSVAFARAEDAAPASSEQPQVESYQFQAEISRLMDIIINSLYSNREIFLRELISNSADALDKTRYLSLTGKLDIGDSDKSKLEIKISYDKQARTISIRDTGIGMTKKGLIDNLGVVAKSGTTEFLKAATQSQDPLTLIGQFGVGFYSVYLVSDKVTVYSKNDEDDQYIWESSADAGFTVAKDPAGNTLGRGTLVTLHLKEDSDEYLNEATLEKIVTRYSEFMNYPIFLQVTKTVEEEVPAEEEKKEEEEEKKEDDVQVSEEEDEKDDKDEKKTKKVTKTVTDWKRLNEVKAVWTRNPKDLSETEYADFYKSMTKDDGGHLSKIHFTAEGEITFKALLYVAKKAPFGLYDKMYDKQRGLKLYVRRVLISDEFDEFLPRYLNFIRGVVDSDDLPLNVSRETLAQNRVLKVMAKKLTRKVLEMLSKLTEKKTESDDEAKEGEESENKETLYDAFWKEYGKSIKLGTIDDRSNRAKLAKLLRFATSKSDGKFVSLESYVERMKEKQKNIYYITGENIEVLKNSPFVEKLIVKDYEVVFMTEPIDEYLVQALTEFDGHQLMSVTKEGLKIEGESKNKLKKMKEQYQELTDWLKNVYGDKVEKVTVSNRIAKSPCVLVTSQYGWSANMERIMRAQAFANADEAKYMHAKKIMEINPYHPLIQELKNKIGENKEDTTIIDLANLMYDASLVTSGFGVRDVKDFSSRIFRVMSTSMGVDPEASVQEEEDDAEEEKSDEPAAPADDGTFVEDAPYEFPDTASSEGASDSSHDEL